MAGTLEVLLLLVNAAAAATLAYIAFKLARLARLLGLPLDPAIAFTALSLGHIAAGTAPLAPDREAFTLYVASATFTAAGLMTLEIQRLRLRTLQPISAPIALLPAAGDAAALAAGTAGILLFRGPARLASLLYATGHAARLASLPLIPSPTSAALLATGEALRAAAALSLAAAYSPKPLSRGSREQWREGEAE